MMIVSAEDMRALDKKAIEEYCIPSLILMENAGRGIADLIFNIYRNGRVTIFVGKGNNGGDGLVIARHLHNRGFIVSVVLLAAPELMKDDPKINYAIICKMKIPIFRVDESTPKEQIKTILDRTDIIVDALIGSGLSHVIRDTYKMAIDAINASCKNVIAVDIPSGINADSGEVLGCAILATYTATLGAIKIGLRSGMGPKHSGNVCVIDISLPFKDISR